MTHFPSGTLFRTLALLVSLASVERVVSAEPNSQSASQAAALRVQPFLQNATPTSIWVVWEMVGNPGGVVEWGPTEALGRTVAGAVMGNNGDNHIYQAQLTNLRPAKLFYYRVRSGGAVTATHTFQTPPARTRTHAPFQFVVLSDTQADGSNPQKLYETTNDGIIRYARAKYDDNLSRALAFALLAGDLVDQGSVYAQWKNEFFDEISNLLTHVPLYPVFGNHEQDSDNFHYYFNLPDNGTAGFEEHWYHFDYGNVRLIGLDTNGNYRTATQLAWLDDVLQQTADAEHIDFVFAQFHHPHKSELWTPGNLDYAGKIVDRLESFTAETGKPSVHFYGHTHGYSRGQRRDHVHLMVNVASGEGNLDYWGEFPNADYPEYARTYAEYGFVVVEVTPGPDPQFTLRRINRGNEIVARDNEEMDTVTIRRNNRPPATPSFVQLDPATPVNPLATTITGGTFSDPDGDAHWETHLQVSTNRDDFTDPVADIWERFENWYAPPGASGPQNGYLSVDTNAGTDIKQITLPTLPEKTELFARIRYRDAGLAWSAWSAPQRFVTGQSPLGPNLLQNASAEQGTAHWDIVSGTFEAIKQGNCSVEFDPVDDEHVFAVGGVCGGEQRYGEVAQAVSLARFADEVDADNLCVQYGGWLRNWSGQDRPQLWLEFVDADGKPIDATPKQTGVTAEWVRHAETVRVPEGTRTIRLHLSGTRNSGTDNDSYFDALFLRTISGGCTSDRNADGAVSFADTLLLFEALDVNDGANLAEVALLQVQYGLFCIVLC